MNWPLIIIVGIAGVALIIFLVVRNLKDEKEVEHQLKDDYPKTKEENNDTNLEG